MKGSESRDIESDFTFSQDRSLILEGTTMSTYNVTCRLANKTFGGKTYDERRQVLIANIRTNELGYWDEPTSFFLAESNLSTDAFAAKACKGLSASDDLVFIFDSSDMSACYFGPVKEVAVLQSIFPKAKKVP